MGLPARQKEYFDIEPIMDVEVDFEAMMAERERIDRCLVRVRVGRAPYFGPLSTPDELR